MFHVEKQSIRYRIYLVCEYAPSYGCRIYLVSEYAPSYGYRIYLVSEYAPSYGYRIYLVCEYAPSYGYRIYLVCEYAPSYSYKIYLSLSIHHLMAIGYTLSLSMPAPGEVKSCSSANIACNVYKTIGSKLMSYFQFFIFLTLVMLIIK